MKNKLILRRIAQSTIEYSVLIAVVAAAIIAMNLYGRRAFKGCLKVIEDQINAQP